MRQPAMPRFARWQGRTSSRLPRALGGADGSGDLVQERKKPRQLVSVDAKAAAVHMDLGPSPVVRLADLRLPHQGHVTTHGFSGVAEHLDHPTVELDHDGPEDDFVHARNYPGSPAEPARRPKSRGSPSHAASGGATGAGVSRRSDQAT